MPVPSIVAAAVQALEDAEDALGVLRVEADAVVGDRDLAQGRQAAPGDASARRGAPRR